MPTRKPPPPKFFNIKTSELTQKRLKRFRDTRNIYYGEFIERCLDLVDFLEETHPELIRQFKLDVQWDREEL